MTGYVRVDTGNNIADGNVISADDLDNEFDGVVAAFNASTGHTHGGAAGEGAPITKVGPTQDVTVTSTLMAPKTTNTVDLGSTTLRYKNLFLSASASIAGTLNVTGVATLGAGAILNTPASVTLTNATGLPISTGVSGLGAGVASFLATALGTGVATFLATPNSTNLRSAVTDETGTGSLVFSTSPVLVTPNLGTPSALVGTNITGTAAGLTAGNVTTNANLTGAVTSVGNTTSLGSFTSAQLAGALTNETGTGSVVFSTSPTLVTPNLGTPSALVGTNITGTAAGLSIGGNSATATALQTARTIGVSGAVTGTATSFNGSANITIPTTVSSTTGGVVYGASTTAYGTTAAGTSGYFLKSNGTAAPSWTVNDLTSMPTSNFKKSCRVATTANITLSGTQTIDGVAVVAGNRVLVKNQTTQSQNGIYIVAAGAWTRSTAADGATEIDSAVVGIDEGTVNGGDFFTNVFKATDVVGTTAMPWYQVVFDSGTWGISVTGNAATATSLQTARTIGMSGVTATATSFNGSANIIIPVTAVPATLLTGTIADARISGSYTGMTNLTGTGTVDFSRFLGNTADTALLPSLSWTTDPNTGIWSPGADQVGITTGGVNRLTVNTTAITSTLAITAPTFNGALSGNATTSSSTTGNAATATALQTARTIGGVSFNGTANINLPGVNTAGNQSTTGNAATATILQTARTINGTSFNGSANITTANWGTARTLWGQSVNGSVDITAPLRPAAGSLTAPAFSTSGDTDTGMFFPAAGKFSLVGNGVEVLTNYSPSEILVGGGTTIGAISMEINAGGTGDRGAVVDFHSAGLPFANDYSARIARYAGVNSALDIVNTGTGDITLSPANASAAFLKVTAGQGMQYNGALRLGSHGSPEGTLDFSCGGDLRVLARGARLDFVNAANSAWSSGVFQGSNIYLRTPDDIYRFAVLSDGRAYLGTGAGSRQSTGYIMSVRNDSIAAPLRSAGYIEWQTDAGVIGTNYFTSDSRLKKNIAPTEKTALQAIDSIEFKQFDWNEFTDRNNEHVELGVVAQQLQQVNPKFVNEMSDSTLGVNEPELLTYALKAIQELSAELSAIKQELSQMKGAV